MQGEITLNEIQANLNIRKKVDTALGRAVMLRRFQSGSQHGTIVPDVVTAGVVRLAEAVSNPFHMWVSITCLVINLLAFYKYVMSGKQVYRSGRI